MLEGEVTIARLVRLLPRRCFAKDVPRGLSALARDLVMIGAVAAAIVVLDDWRFGLPLAVLLGMVIGAAFVVGHDAGHGSFSDSPVVNEIVGTIATLATLLPFHAWRWHHDQHHKFAHHLKKDNSWLPLSAEALAALPAPRRFLYRALRTWLWPLHTIATSLEATPTIVLSGVFGGKDSPFTAKERWGLRRSALFTILYALVAVPLAYIHCGVYGLVCLIAIPNVVFHGFLALVTLLQHTSPDTPYFTPETWSPGVATLTRTIHTRYPAWFDWLTHDISWHLTHHIAPAVPYYRLRTAEAALVAALPGKVRTQPFRLGLIRETLLACHAIAAGPMAARWVGVAESLMSETRDALDDRSLIHETRGAILSPE